MKLLTDEMEAQPIHSIRVLIGLTITLTLLALSAGAQAQPGESNPVESNSSADTYQTLYVAHLTQQNDANDLLSDLRNMLPKARLFYVPSQNAISIRATSEDMRTAQKILSEVDRAKKVYRLTYTINESDSGKHISTQHLALVVVSGGKTELKQGNRVPIVTGTVDAKNPAQNSQVQYVDVGLSIEAILDGVRLHTKVEQSGLADEKSNIGTQDPVIHQTTLEGTATLAQGKPIVLGSLDIPGSTRHQEIEVVSELVQ